MSDVKLKFQAGDIITWTHRGVRAVGIVWEGWIGLGIDYSLGSDPSEGSYWWHDPLYFDSGTPISLASSADVRRFLEKALSLGHDDILTDMLTTAIMHDGTIEIITAHEQ